MIKSDDRLWTDGQVFAAVSWGIKGVRPDFSEAEVFLLAGRAMETMRLCADMHEAQKSAQGRQS